MCWDVGCARFEPRYEVSAKPNPNKSVMATTDSAASGLLKQGGWVPEAPWMVAGGGARLCEREPPDGEERSAKVKVCVPAGTLEAFVYFLRPCRDACFGPMYVFGDPVVLARGLASPPATCRHASGMEMLHRIVRART